MREKIKIVHVLHSVGGVDVSIRTILSCIDVSKFDSIVVHGTADTNDPFEFNNGTQAHTYKISIHREINILKDFKATWLLVKILKKERPNLIHAHSAKGGVIARIASLFYKVTVLHTPQAYSFLSKPTGFKRNIFLKIENFLKNFNSILLASSKSELSRGLNEVGYKENRTRIFNNSIKPVKIVGNSDFVHSLPEKYIATVGRPSFQKNIESMLLGISKVKLKIPNINLVVMGVGHYSPNLESIKILIRKLGLESNVTLIEWQDRQNILEAIAASSFYISTARYEGLPYSVIEAMAVGKALVLTDVDGNRDLLRQGKNGFLIEEHDENALARKIIYLHQNEETRSKMGAQSKKIYDNQHNMEVQIKHLERLYVEFSN